MPSRSTPFLYTTLFRSGVISPGGIGFDINCGMRLVITNLTFDEVQPRLKEIVDLLFQRVPAGVGSHGFLKLSHDDFRDVVEQDRKSTRLNSSHITISYAVAFYTLSLHDALPIWRHLARWYWLRHQLRHAAGHHEPHVR